MRALKMKFVGGQMVVDWGAEEAGAHQLKSKVANHFLNRRGTDKTSPDHGTDLDTQLMSLGAFDSVGVQHELNFAVINVFQALRGQNSNDPASSLASFRASFGGFSNGRALVSLQVVNAAGDTIGATTEI